MSGYLTVAGVAEQLDVSPRTVLRWVERGDLPAVRLPGGRLRVAKSDIDAALQSWQTTPRRRTLAAVDEGGE